MKHLTKNSAHACHRALISISASAVIAISLSSCGGGIGGMLGRDKSDSDAAILASEDEPKKKRKPFSLFNRSKDNNAWISDDENMTRRDRMARKNGQDFATTPAPTPAPSAAPAARTSKRFTPEPGPLTPNDDLELDPRLNSPPTPAPRMTSSNSRAEDQLLLPTLDSDFPDAGGSPPPIQPAPRRSTYDADDGYTPLQPKLPGAESIQPPTD